MHLQIAYEEEILCLFTVKVPTAIAGRDQLNLAKFGSS
jgi:hypothetical protein